MVWIKKSILLGLLLTGSSSIWAHEFYVSICTIKEEGDHGKLRVAVKTFTNDLEEALVNRGAKRPFLDTDEEHINSDSLIASYLLSVLNLQINDRAALLKFHKKRYELDATWSIFFVESPPVISTLAFQSDLLLEVFEDQTNLVRVTIAGERLMATLDGRLRKESFTFKPKED